MTLRPARIAARCAMAARAGAFVAIMATATLAILAAAAGPAGAGVGEPERSRLGRLDPWVHLTREEAAFDPDVLIGAAAAGTWRLMDEAGFDTELATAVSFDGRLHVAAAPLNQIGGLASWNEVLGWQDEVSFFAPWVVLPFGNDLVVAGWHAYGNIRLWDGNELVEMGAGLSGIAGTEGTIVNTVAMHAGSLYAGGNLWDSDGVLTGPVARWDGVAWQPNGEGLTGRVRSLISQGGQLLAAGDFEIRDAQQNLLGVGVARWTGTRWVPHGVGAGGPGYSLAYLDGVLYCAGEFDVGAGRGIAPSVVRLEGATWVPIGEISGTVRQLFGLAGELWAGGEFGEVDGLPVGNVAVWDGVSWSDPGGTEPEGSVRSFAVHDGELYMVGRFDWAGTTETKNIARRTGEAWTSFGGGFDSEVHGIRRIATGMHAFGEFQRAGGAVVSGVARWDGFTWIGYGDGFDRRVHDLVVFRGELIATGRFQWSGNEPVSSIARWDGSAWKPLGTGLNDWGYALAVLDDTLYVGGAFTQAGGVDATGLAAWDGTQWSGVAGGLAGGVPFGPSVFALEATLSGLAVGGAFEQAGGLDVSNVAFFEAGAWVAPGAGLDHWVMSFTLRSQELLAGGAFSQKIARWDGSAWLQFGNLPYTVLALSNYGTDGVAAIHPGLHDVMHLYDGSSWFVRNGFTHPEALNCVEWEGGELWIGGPFTRVAGEPTQHVARWKPDVAPRPLAIAPASPEPRPADSSLIVLTNPFRDRLALRLDAPREVGTVLELFDVAGRRRGRITEGPGGSRRIEWDLGGVPAGVYFVRLRTGDAEQTRKVVKVR